MLSKTYNLSVSLNLNEMDLKKNYRKIIYTLKKKFQMEVAKGIMFDLHKYSIIKKGEL